VAAAFNYFMSQVVQPLHLVTFKRITRLCSVVGRPINGVETISCPSKSIIKLYAIVEVPYGAMVKAVELHYTNYMVVGNCLIVSTP